jgi:hypothetical protein
MKDTIELCKEAGYPLMTFDGKPYVSPELERLVALVRADERAAPVQEPVAWRFTGIAGFKRFVTDAQHKGLPLEVRAWYEPFKCASCTTPPAAQRQWVGLTLEEILETYRGPDGSDYVDYARGIEAKLKEKNT